MSESITRALAREMMRAHLQKDYAPYLKDIANGGQD